MTDFIIPSRFGRIPVAIFKADREIRYDQKNVLTNGDRPNKVILLVYKYVFPDGYFVLCPIRGHRENWYHMRMNTFQFNTLRGRHKYVPIRDVAEAEKYLREYCHHFGFSLSDFILCDHMKELGHFSLREDGVDECPCKKDFTL